MTGKQHEEGVQLIRNAFSRARETGAPEWRTMTAAVLKNRILDLTSRAFDEADWGASSFRVFLEQFDDVVAVDASTRPPRVTIREDATALAPSSERDGLPDIGPQKRVRADLWNAVLDYSGRWAYLWDDGRVTKAVPDRLPAGGKVLPSLTKAEFKGWRSDFLDRIGGEHAGAQPFLRNWLEREEPLATLPPEFRIPWVVELKGRVLKRLQDWFRDNNVIPPLDLVVGEDETLQASQGKGAEDLRQYVLAAVREMTAAELGALQLPASVAFRVKR